MSFLLGNKSLFGFCFAAENGNQSLPSKRLVERPQRFCSGKTDLRHIAVECLAQRGDSAAAFQIDETRDRSQSYLDILVIQHRFELGEVWLPRAGQAE